MKVLFRKKGKEERAIYFLTQNNVIITVKNHRTLVMGKDSAMCIIGSLFNEIAKWHNLKCRPGLEELVSFSLLSAQIPSPQYFTYSD